MDIEQQQTGEIDESQQGFFASICSGQPEYHKSQTREYSKRQDKEIEMRLVSPGYKKPQLDS